MKVLIIGGVASATKVAAKLKREDRSLDVAIITKEADISYASCGLPYYVGKVVEDKSKLIVNTPKAFSGTTGTQVITQTEVISINSNEKNVTAKALATGEQTVYTYDKLIIASGASAYVPDIDGVNLKNVFVMRTLQDAVCMREAIESGEIKRAVIVGGGYVGLEIARNLNLQGIKTNIIESSSHILSSRFDSEFCDYLENKMAQAGVMAMTEVSLTGISGDGKVEKVLTSKRPIKADAVILAMGIVPNTDFLQGSEIETEDGVIVTNDNFETNVKDIYAIGDCAYVKCRITNNKTWSTMGSTANIVGRVLAQNIASNPQTYLGILGTSISKLPGEINVACTGLTEKSAKEAGFDVETAIMAGDDKANYYTDSGNIIIKLVVDKTSHKILGAQVVGDYGVDKIIDIVVTAISLGATIYSMQNLDFAYAPPFSTAIHPLSHAINVLINKMDGKFITVTPNEFKELDLSEYKIIDVSKAPTVANADFLDLSEISESFDKYDKDDNILIICTRGRRAFVAQNKLAYYGYKNTHVLEAGALFTEIKI